MGPLQDSDADILWHDVLMLLEAQGIQPSLLAMLKSCSARSFDGESLHIETSMTFAQRKIMQHGTMIEGCLEQAAFQPVTLCVDLARDTMGTHLHLTEAPRGAGHVGEEHQTHGPVQGTAPKPTRKPVIAVETTITPDQLGEVPQRRRGGAGRVEGMTTTETYNRFESEAVEVVDSKLTFDRFVAGEENMLAYEAAKQVANGENKSYNPLFIHGKSGLGKTHLLRAIQNYIVHNDPSRLCVYRTAAEFIEEYRIAWNDSETSARSVLSKSYQNVDVLIIDDIQNMRTAAGTIRFFFETFNALVSHGKQIVCAADRSPLQLGTGDSKFDERETSRMDSGVTVSIQVPDYELKLNLINNFYEHMKQDAINEHLPLMDGTISEEMRRLMADRSGTNIRVIEGFVHACLMDASRKKTRDLPFTREDIIRIANSKWPTGQKIITVDQIQKAIEGYYDISHNDLVGAKRNKELMEPRHVAIWLTRKLTDHTLADIGKKFGGRSHATVEHSIARVDKAKREDRIFHDRVQTLHDSITDSS